MRDLVQVAEKVYRNRETEEEKEARLNKEEDKRQMKWEKSHEGKQGKGSRTGRSGSSWTRNNENTTRKSSIGSKNVPIRQKTSGEPWEG